MCRLNNVAWCVWTSLAVAILFPDYVYSQRWYDYVSLTEPEHRFNLTKSGELGMNVWNISAEDGHIVMLAFENFNILCYTYNQVPDYCDCVKIEVYDGPSMDTSRLLLQQCSSNGNWPVLLTSSTNNMLFVLSGKQSMENHQYFIAIYKTVLASNVNRNCGGNVTGVEGVIMSPNFPNNYDNLVICDWTIRVDSNLRIQLEIQDLEIEYSSGCTFDSLSVYDGIAVSPYYSLRQCGEITTSYIHSVLNQNVFIRFISNWNVTRKGFMAKWTTGKTYIHFTKPASSIFYPGYCQNGTCVWNITVNESDVVQLAISWFYAYYCYSAIPCDCTSLEVYDGPHITNESLLLRLCYDYDYFPNKLTSRTNNMVLVLRQSMYVSISMSAYYTSVRPNEVCNAFSYNQDGLLQSPLYPSDYPNNTVCVYSITLYSPGYQLVFNFTDFSLQGGTNGDQCYNDYVEFYGLSNWWTKRYCGNSLPPGLVSNESTRVRFVSDGTTTGTGFQLKYTSRLVQCGPYLYTGQEGTLTSPGYPYSYPHVINCSWTILLESEQVIVFTFDYINIGASWGGPTDGDRCPTSYAIAQVFEDSDTGNKILTGTYCGIVVPVPVIFTRNLTVGFISQRNYNLMSGFSASYKILDKSQVFLDCGGNITGTGGVITSPQFPKQYPNNTQCVWIITGSPGFPIKVSFTDFNLQESAVCRNDSLEIRDGLSFHSSRLDRLCGNAIPLDLMSTGNAMYIKFFSDSTLSYKGFNATWASVCHQTFIGYSSTLQSPSYPQSYPSSIECTYVIQRYSNYVLRLTFSTLNLGYDSNDCQRNYVEVRDGGFEGSPLLARYCSNQSQVSLTSRQGNMWIRFVTNGSTSNTGFRATFTREHPCGPTSLTGRQGNLTSPYYPYNYGINTQCTWTITTDINRVIQLTISDFLLEGPSGFCPYDWVKVTDGNSLIGIYCGVSYEPVITTTGNAMTIVFKSDSSRTFTGFKATYTTYDPLTEDISRQYDLYPFGLENGDTMLPKRHSAVARLVIQTGFPVAKSLQKDVYIANKGLVTFGKRDSGKGLKLKKDRMMICTYNADIGARDTDGGVFYQLHTTNQTILDKASAEVREFTDFKTYTASLVVVVTWYKVSHMNSINPAKEQATVQLALISNGVRSFALVYYRTDAMKWSYLKGEKLVIGIAKGIPSQAVESVYSRTKEAFTSMGSTKGNTGHRGMWIYDVGDSYSADQACINWYIRNLRLREERESGFERLPQCPCSRTFLRGHWVYSHLQSGDTAECYRLSFGISSLVTPHGKECCYGRDWSAMWSFGQYVPEGPNAGASTAYNPEFQITEYKLEDREAHDTCCYKASSPKYCKLYQTLRPPGECTTRIPFRFSFIWGDPHIKTLDGGEYTFNGWGEYTMVTLSTGSTNFTLQGRTGLAETENGTLTNATVFKAFGAEENGVRVFVELDPNTNESLVIYADNVDYTLRFYDESSDVVADNENFLLKRDNDSCVFVFTSGIEMTVSVGFKSLQISITIPLTYQNQTKGLMGNFNGIKDDDFVLPNGTTLSPNITDRQIFSLFGTAWSVSTANSIMRYGPREGPANYTHPEFTPIFLDEQPASKKKAAEDLCGVANLACIYDYIATGSAAIANSTKDSADTADELEKTSKNTVPVLMFNSTLVLNSGENFTFNLLGFDPDVDDALTYHMIGGQADQVHLNSQTGDVNIKINISRPVILSFYAVDSKNISSPVRDVTLIICSGCSNHGSCDLSSTITSEVSPRVHIAECICSPAWTGSGCSDNYDACLENPCSAQQVCTDLTPEQQGNSSTGFTCSSCSQGYTIDTTDPSRCVDINECQSTLSNNCSDTCENTPGSYVCSCNFGFRLKQDGATCEDINECAEHTDTCQQVCRNTAGSFQCGCNEGYYMSQGVCVRQSNNDVCQGAGCAHGCSVQTYSNGTSVPACFCNAGYQVDSSDSKQCVDKNECTEDVCSQSCINTDGSFTCTCFAGNILSSDQRTCVPCENMRYGPECRLTCECNGKALECHPVRGCVCQDGWTGSQCEIDVDECAENQRACPAGQICTNVNGSFTCSCPSGYVMDTNGTCVDVNECSTGSLLNTCNKREICVNVPGTFYCSCKPGYKHTNGSCTDIDECANNGGVCQQLCVNVIGSYNCDCYYGYRLNTDRYTCKQVSDVCAEFEGLHCEHACTLNDSDQGVCICNIGYTLAANQQNCTEIDACTTGTSGCSHNCTRSKGGVVCSCPLGKTLDNDRKTCIDCPAGTYGENCTQICACGLGATHCDAKTGCVCQTGWTGSKCDRDVNECDMTSVQQECQNTSSVCVNTQGGYRCQCEGGYQQGTNGICQDVDECTSSPCHQICENSIGSYRCLCQKGFSLNSTTGQCVDVNECALPGTHACTQRCDNIAGSYRCSCNVAGYVLANDGFTCIATTNCSRTDCPTVNGGCSEETCFCNNGYQLNTTFNSCDRIDVDLCASGVCEQSCRETEDGNSFICSCDDGFLLNNDKRTCRACPAGSYGTGCNSNCTCNTHNTVSCNTMNGTCTCKAGWTGANCSDDIDECATPGISPCTLHAKCVNIAGGFLCPCEIGFVKTPEETCQACQANYYGENCAQKCECDVDLHSCDSVNGTCLCNGGWEGSRCDIDVDECSSGKHSCSVVSSVCVNTNGSYLCECKAGYVKNGTGACIDIDECATNTTSCSHICMNVENGFHCSCPIDMTLDTDKKNCRDCPAGTYGDNCTQICACGRGATRCNTTNGCICSSGWTGATCDTDINECDVTAVQQECQGKNAVCFNTEGSYRCQCSDGFIQTDSGMCQVCPENLYGENCSSVCNCSVNTQSCDNVNGSCTCKAGWEGFRCEDDIDECTTGKHNCLVKSNVCVNTDGSFKCECSVGYALDSTGTCKELKQVDMELTVQISVPTSDLSDSNSVKYAEWKRLTMETLQSKFRPSIKGFKEIRVNKLRIGSLVIEATVMLDNQSDPNALSSLSVVLIQLDLSSLTIGNQSGQVTKVTVIVSGSTIQVSQQSSSCQLMSALSPCTENKVCEEVGGLPVCSDLSDSPDQFAMQQQFMNTVRLIIGLSVGIPCAFIIAGVVAFIFLTKKSEKKKISHEYKINK